MMKEIDRLYNHFTVRLKNRYPKINDDQLHLCCLLRMGMDSYGIIRCLNITKEYLRAKKYRLAKRLQIRNKHGQLVQFIAGF